MAAYWAKLKIWRDSDIATAARDFGVAAAASARGRSGKASRWSDGGADRAGVTLPISRGTLDDVLSRRRSTACRSRRRTLTGPAARRRDGSRCIAGAQYARSRRCHIEGSGQRARWRAGGSGYCTNWPRVSPSSTASLRSAGCVSMQYGSVIAHTARGIRRAPFISRPMSSHGSRVALCAAASRCPSRSSDQNRARASA